jgi:hypothetical protein
MIAQGRIEDFKLGGVHLKKLCPYLTSVSSTPFQGEQYCVCNQGWIQGGAPGARPPKIDKNMIFWHKIVIFHTKYPKYFRASLRSAQYF